MGRHFVGMDVDLDAKGTADVFANHADLRLLQPKVRAAMF